MTGAAADAGLNAMRCAAPIRSAAAGMTRVPLNPILDAGRMLDEAADLVQALEICADDLPFPPFPELEHWLLDQDAEPLALLGTAVDETQLDEMAGSEWSAGGRGEQPFVASSLIGVADSRRRGSDGRRHHTEVLERQVREAAGRRLNAQWFRREPEGLIGLAHRAPKGLDGIWRLYPKILDQDLINRARVEARLRRAGADTARGQV